MDPIACFLDLPLDYLGVFNTTARISIKHRINNLISIVYAVIWVICGYMGLYVVIWGYPWLYGVIVVIWGYPYITTYNHR